MPVGVESSPSIEFRFDKTLIFFCFTSSITAGAGTDNLPCSV